MSKEVVVIGGGPAGIEAAREAAKLGLDVTLVSAEQVGGRAGWHSLLPSKVWLAAAEAAHAAPGMKVDPQAILAQVAAVKQSWNGQERASLDALGVKVVQGTAVFVTTGELTLLNAEGERTHTFNDVPVIVASGSVPVFPSGLKPDGKRVIAPRMLSKLGELPQSMLVVGAGATGCEVAYLFNALGVAVTWIVDQYGFLPLFEKSAGEALGQALENQGVTIVRGQMVADLDKEEGQVSAVLTNGQRHTAEMAFVAVGRRPDLENLNLWAVGVKAGENGRIKVDPYGRTANPAVYLVGDADGGVMTANKAQAQGRTAARHLAGEDVAPFDLSTVIQPVYTEPQVAQVGDVSGDMSARIPFAKSLKSHLLPQGDGFLQLYYDEEGRILGAVAVGPHAADVVSPIAVAIKLGGKLDDLADLFAAYPSMSELPSIAARSVS